ncbi:unnamed protein product [Microthlaspi erraticum]|uniref:PUM-HD domain-containing protein n=1 Tax=Microthlaspi erraticum TaxID=1685480 RepID=A0A6D2JVB3_9BRAS|nr:unnamed protein product [Microthlaspi erraticum]
MEMLPYSRHQLFSHLSSDLRKNHLMCSALLNIFPQKKSQLLSFFTSNIVELMMEDGDLEPLFTRIMSFFDQQGLEAFLTVIAGSAQLAAAGNGNVNAMLALIKSAAHRLVSLASILKGSLLLQNFISSFHHSVGDIVVEILQGRFMEFSSKAHANFFVQSCFKVARWRSCLLIALELDAHFHSLVKHPCGNYVLQALIRRYKSEKCPIPLLLLSLITNSRHTLSQDKWGKSVVYVFDA